MSKIAILTTIFGTIMALGYFPQAYRIWKLKSAESISLSMFTIFSIGSACWLVYGISIHDIPLTISSIVGTTGCWLVYGLSLYYKKARR